ncbi:MAG: tetratricopeptide repeat protein [Verrucomicrobia bacterium]|nr:tetratricopeptide repeat protein [Verrucomicrobiota bacterium]
MTPAPSVPVSNAAADARRLTSPLVRQAGFLENQSLVNSAPTEQKSGANQLSEASLARLSEFVADRMGLLFPKARWRDLERGIRTAAKEFNFPDPESCARWLLSSPLSRQQIETLAGDLTVGETYFFREKGSFEILGEQILPEIIRTRKEGCRQLRVWSAGCCTGEEPYSIAIFLQRALPDAPQWQIRIVATDINPRFLRHAERGVYSEWSFRDAPPWLKAECFRRAGGRHFEILREIQRQVTFARLNLAEDSYPSLLNETNAVDLIFCRNVLMYFAPERARKVIENFHRCLAEGGWLIVSPAEASLALFPQFRAVHFSGVTYFRKDSRTHAPTPPEIRSRRREEADSVDSEFRIPNSEIGVSLPRLTATELQPFQTRSEGSRFDESTQGASASLPLPQARSTHPSEPTASREFEPKAASLAPSAALAEAKELCGQGQYAEAGAMLRRLLRVNAETPEAAALLAHVLANQGRLAEAQEWIEKAIVADKVNPAFHFLRAGILRESGDLREAVATLKRALYLDPDFVLAHFALGNLARQDGHERQARRCLDTALRLLRVRPADEVLPASDGLTAGRLAEIIEFMLSEIEPEQTRGGLQVDLLMK